MFFPENAPCDGHRFAHQRPGFFEVFQIYESKMVAEGTKHAAEIGVITKADDIVCAVHAYKAGATKNVAMRFYYAGAAL
jgi:hypothetical protein